MNYKTEIVEDKNGRNVLLKMLPELPDGGDRQGSAKYLIAGNLALLLVKIFGFSCLITGLLIG